MRTIRVAWDNAFARRNQTGTGVYATRLLGALQERNDVEIQVLEPAPNAGTPSNAFARAFQTGVNLIWTHTRLPDRLALGGADLLHSPAYIAPIGAPCPTVVTIHDITYLLFPEHFAGWWVAYMKAIMPRVVRSAAAIICGSAHSQRDILEAYKIPATKVHVIPYGIDHSRYRPDAKLDQDWAQALGIRPGYLLHVGGLARRKNIPALLHAVARLRRSGKWDNRQVVLAGAELPSMLGAGEIHSTIHNLRLEDAVVLPGRVPDQHLAGLYSQASVLVMPSLYEGFGFPVLEAMAAGTPVIASNSSSLPEVTGAAGLLINPQNEADLADAICAVLTDSRLAEQLRAKGLEHAARYNWEHTADETVKVYRSVI